MVTFWDTVRGQALADTLIRELPLLTENKRQYTQSFARKSEAMDFVKARINQGDRYVDKIESEDGVICIIMQAQSWR